MTEATALTGLLPLLPPPPPATTEWLALLPALALLLPLLLVLWWRRPAGRLARRLGRLDRRLSRPDADTRDIATALDHWLRDRLTRPRLHADQPPADLPAEQWGPLLRRLQQLRFGPRPPAQAELTALLGDIRQLLRGRHG